MSNAISADERRFESHFYTYVRCYQLLIVVELLAGRGEVGAREHLMKVISESADSHERRFEDEKVQIHSGSLDLQDCQICSQGAL